MHAVDIIRKKRDNQRLSQDEIRTFVTAVTDGSWPDYQASALLMAIWLRGMDAQETIWLTTAMVDSGVRVDLSAFRARAGGAVPVDKHSTGGVGDKTSLIIAPLAAACGAIVPMMSGRGLGHTGGTLDKLESIPGFRTSLSLEELRSALERTGCAMIGQTAQVAPADRKLYALRDVTGTIESIALISASIMSKKIAEGIGALVLDVKTGAGAFMKSLDDSRALARSLAAIGNASGVRTEAMITPMDAPLGRAVGNALEVVESIETLQGRGPRDLTELSLALTARMLVLSGVAASDEAADAQARQALASGAALERFRDIVSNQGGDARAIDDVSRLPRARDVEVFRARASGTVSRMHAELVGRAGLALGAGRRRAEDAVDPAVGFIVVAPVGTAVNAGDPVIEIHHNGRGLEEARALLADAIDVGAAAPAARPLVIETIGRETS